MSAVPDPADPPAIVLGTGALHALESALDQNHGVKAKVDAFANELASSNQHTKAQIAQGATTMPATKALQRGIAAERQVQEVADDLQQVNDHLAQGLGKVQQVEQALSRSRQALTESKAALASSIDAEREASWRAMHDAQTGLPNRSLFADRLAQAMAGAERHGWTLALLFMDLDRFKHINDSYGHAAGDTVLSTVASRLLSQVRDEDSVCRNGGDEFLYLLINPGGRDNVGRIARLVHETIMQPIQHATLSLVITPSIGIALYPDHADGLTALIDRADAAMYRAKQRGSAFEFYRPT